MGEQEVTGNMGGYPAAGAIKENWRWFMGLGIALVLVGTVAVAVPAPFTLAITLVLGWVFIVAGAAQFIHAFKSKGWKDVFWSALVGVVYCLAGAMVLAHPIFSALSLTLLLACALLADGGVRAVMAFRMRAHKGWTWVLFSAGISILLGLMILGEWPSTAAWVLGVMVGISLIFNGWSMIMIASAARNSK